MYDHLEVYCETCCALPGEKCAKRFLVSCNTLLTTHGPSHIARVKRSMREERGRQIKRLMLPPGLPEAIERPE